MMTRVELYGGSQEIIYETPNEVFVMPDYTDWRVWWLGSDDISTGTFVFRLPDPQTIRQHGWLVFALFNDTNQPVDVQTADSNVIGFMNNGEAMLLGLASAEFPVGAGSWCTIKKDLVFAPGSNVTFTNNYGSSGGTGDDADQYSYTLDTWTSLPVLPLVSGVGVDIGASDSRGVGTDVDSFYGQFAEFYQWFPSGGPVLKQTPAYKFRQTGLGLIQGSALGDLMHVSNDAVDGPTNSRKMEVYGVSGDTWTSGPDFPTIGSLDAPDAALCQTIGVEEFDMWCFLSPSTPDLAASFVAYDQVSQIWLTAAYPPWPHGPFRPSIVGINSRMHFQGGSYSSASPVINSTDSHDEFNPFLNTWQVLSPLPVVGRGLGCRALNEPRDRYTFGMGETTSVPSEVHFEYNINTRTYTAKGTFVWGTNREERESAWSSFLP